MRPSDEEVRETAINWLKELDHYPTERELVEACGSFALSILKEKNDVIIDDDGEVILVAITNPKQQKLVDESVPCSKIFGV